MTIDVNQVMCLLYLKYELFLCAYTKTLYICIINREIVHMLFIRLVVLSWPIGWLSIDLR